MEHCFPISYGAVFLWSVAVLLGMIGWGRMVALAGLIFVRMAPRRGVNFLVSESWYGLRNRYYRWKRRKAARKFEVYMRKQGRTVHLDGQGRQIDDDDKKRWN